MKNESHFFWLGEKLLSDSIILSFRLTAWCNAKITIVKLSPFIFEQSNSDQSMHLCILLILLTVRLTSNFTGFNFTVSSIRQLETVSTPLYHLLLTNVKCEKHTWYSAQNLPCFFKEWYQDNGRYVGHPFIKPTTLYTCNQKSSHTCVLYLSGSYSWTVASLNKHDRTNTCFTVHAKYVMLDAICYFLTLKASGGMQYATPVSNVLLSFETAPGLQRPLCSPQNCLKMRQTVKDVGMRLYSRTEKGFGSE